jgi:hypothetical protein
MKRCPRKSPAALPATVLTVLLALGGLLIAPSWAQTEVAISVRQFPQEAVRGLLVVQAPPVITLNGKEDRLSPGARIRNANNHYVLAANLTGQELLVNYTRDRSGQVHNVWLLNADEARENRAGMDTRNFRFSSEAEQPAQDDGATAYDQLPRYRQ